MRTGTWLIIAALLCSCSKNEATAPTPTGITNVVTRLVQLDTTLQAPFDTVSVTNFSYDANGRVKTVTENSFDPFTWVYTPKFSFTYYYQGASELPYKVWQDQHYTTAYPLSLTHFLGYDAAQRLIRDSVLQVKLQTNDSSIYRHSYRYLANGHEDSLVGYKPSYSEYAEYVYLQRDVDEKVIQSTTEYGNKVVTTIQYDGHINPLFKLAPVKAPYFENEIYPGFIGKYSPQSQGFKTISSAFYDAGGTVILNTKLQQFYCSYRADGLPLSVTCHTDPAMTTDKYKYVFVYGTR